MKPTKPTKRTPLTPLQPVDLGETAEDLHAALSRVMAESREAITAGDIPVIISRDFSKTCPEGETFGSLVEVTIQYPFLPHAVTLHLHGIPDAQQLELAQRLSMLFVVVFSQVCLQGEPPDIVA